MVAAELPDHALRHLTIGALVDAVDQDLEIDRDVDLGPPVGGVPALVNVVPDQEDAPDQERSLGLVPGIVRGTDGPGQRIRSKMRRRMVTKKRMVTVRLRKKSLLILMVLKMIQLRMVKLKKKTAVQEANHASDPEHRGNAQGHATVGLDQGNVAQGPGQENAVQDLGGRAGLEIDAGIHGQGPDLGTVGAAKRVKRARGQRTGM